MKTHTRRKVIVGNWKMHTIATEAASLAKAVVDGLGTQNRVSVAICPPFPYLALVGAILKGSPVALGAQNLYPEKEGAFTGEVSPKMLLDLGCKYVILGHSERRHVLGESDAFINRKVRCALEAGLDIFLCVGETLKERNARQTQAVLDRQVRAGLSGVSINSVSRVTIGYEPVWAIGGGPHATPAQEESSLTLIRRCFGRIFGPEPADGLCIQYGGSVSPENAAALLAEPDCDGALIGGDSLNADEFLAIIRAGIGEQPAKRKSA